ncbi:MAG: hypothetical protein KDA91_02580 [Planctomycetaceae bacterium]|nr:hypothetical protein [Planctomycetaceae bacterium]
MSYRQLFLLILTIWSAEIVTRVLFDALIPRQMEYRTLYLEKDQDGMFKGSAFADLGDRGWQLVSAVPSPDKGEQFILFFQRQCLLKPRD